MSKITYQRYEKPGVRAWLTRPPRGVEEKAYQEQCGQNSPKDGNGMTWVCTLRKDHDDEHVAHSNGVPCLAWMSDDE